MRKITALLLALLPLLTIAGQEIKPLRGNCTPLPESTDALARLAGGRHLLTLKTQWDSTRVYPVLVVLVEFSDRAFSSEEPLDLYQRMFSESGFNGSRGPGCVEDYFRSQSNGWFKPRFDVYGPVKVNATCKGNGEYGGDAFRQATQALYDSLHIDFNQYDWDGNGRAEAAIFVYAGYGANEGGSATSGSIWPNTSSFSQLILGDVVVSEYSASAELWSNDKSCGIGTICHEYSHSLGLPDFYPTSGSEYSVVDEWDLMDGGNYVNNGWCPPNYSIHEKMLLGWDAPEELTEAVSISGLAPLSQGGKAYIVRTDDNDEYFLLENRQWNDWDLRTPGHGLLISHVHYSFSAWASNSVNSTPTHHRYELVHADNMDYNAWEAFIGPDVNPKVGGHNRILSGSPYPLITDSTENRHFTDSSVPAAVIYSGSGLLGKPITDIEEAEDGTVSFVFLAERLGLTTVADERPHHSYDRSYDLMGRPAKAGRKGLVVSGGKIIFQR